MLGSIGYFAVGSIGKLPLITMIFEKLVKPLKKNLQIRGYFSGFIRIFNNIRTIFVHCIIVFIFMYHLNLLNS